MQNQIVERLHSLVNQTESFMELMSILRQFNPFKVLSVDEYEIRHSNFLAWLLNPNENHSIGDKFLRQFFSEVISTSKYYSKYSFKDLKTKGLQNTEVLREYKIENGQKVDLIVVIHEFKTVILIENKIKAKEHSDQLTAYYDFVKGKYLKYRVVPIYLTLFGDDPKNNDEYFSYSYEQIFNNINMLLKSYRNTIPDRQYEFINQYKEALQEVLEMADAKAIQLAKDIYSEYRDVFNFVFENAITNKFHEACNNFFKKNGLIQVASAGNQIFFINSNINNMKDQKMGNWKCKKPICLWFRKNGEAKLGIVIEIGPLLDLKKRNSILEKFHEKGFKYQKGAIDAGTKYTRVFSIDYEFYDWNETEQIEECLEKLFNDAAGEKIQIMNAIIKNENSLYGIKRTNKIRASPSGRSPRIKKV
jgi:hypothetical protein